MPFGTRDQNAAVLPYRKTTVTFDNHLPAVQQPWIGIQRPADQMAQSSQAEKDGVHYIDGIGWMLKGWQYDWGNLAELNSAQPGILAINGSGINTAPLLETANIARQQSLTGVTYNTDVPVTGFPGLVKRVPAGDTWESVLFGDSVAWPAPNVLFDAVTMDRVAKSIENHEPEDGLFFYGYIPGQTIMTSSSILNLHFSGPAGADDKGVGTGQYCLKLYTDGGGELWERNRATFSWILRHKLTWDPYGKPGENKLIVVGIYSNCYNDGSGAFYGDSILFRFGSFQTNNVLDQMAGVAISVLANRSASIIKQNGWYYKAPQKEVNSTVLAPVRVDIRRDVRAYISLGEFTYPETGVLYDDIISVPIPPTANSAHPFYLYWYGHIPPECTLDAQLYDADTGVILSDETTILLDNQGGIKSYTPNALQRRYRVKVTFTTSDTRKTPVLGPNGVQLLRSNVFETPLPTSYECPSQDAAPALPKTSIVGMNIQGAQGDPSGSGASFGIEDFVGDLEEINTKGGYPVKIETTYDSGGTNKSILFRGYLQTASYKKVSGPKPASSNDYAGTSWRSYQYECAGEWSRLSEAMAPMKYTWYDKLTNQPMKITDVIRDLLSIAYPAEMIDVPDLSVRLFPKNAQALTLECGAFVGEAAFSLARDYLGSYIVFDENSGTAGKWRMLQPQQPPYIPLARFYINHPGSGKLPHVAASYGTSTSGAQTVLHGFIEKGSDSTSTERPEGNLIAVRGGAAGQDAAESGTAGNGSVQFSQIAVNVNSYNFLGLADGDPGYPDGTHPDYLGRCVPISIVDSTLTSQTAVDWMARRVYDFAAHSRKKMTFTAPLLLVTVDGDYDQTAPRPLRFYDCVEVEQEDGTFDKFLVLSCSPVYSNDGFQMARYEIVRPSNMDELASMPVLRPSSIFKMYARAMRSLSGTPPQNEFWTSNKASSNDRSVWMALPEPTGLAIQDLDNTSPDFGTFLYMMDYDPLP